SSGASSRPAGRPSSTAVRPGPCDSPAVVKRSAIAPLSLPAALRGLALRREGGQLEQVVERLQPVRLAAGGTPVRVGRLGLRRRRGALVLRSALGLLGSERDALDARQLERVVAAAVECRECLLVSGVLQAELYERAGVRRRLADALARSLILRGVDEEHRLL